MGHSRCGAVAARWTRDPGHRAPSDNVRDIVERIAPSISELLTRPAVTS